MEFYYCSTCKEMKTEVKCEKKCKLYQIEINDKLLQRRLVTADEIGKTDITGVLKRSRIVENL